MVMKSGKLWFEFLVLMTILSSISPASPLGLVTVM